MNTQKLLVRSSALVAAALLSGGAPSARAVPVNGLYLEDNRCDPLPNQPLTHELGDAATFPPNEAILVNIISTPHQTVCVPDDGQPNDWEVQMLNVSGIPWQDLYFVVDIGGTVGNADGTIIDVTAPLLRCDAFRIDGTVTLGGNANLLFESMGVNEIFEPGEIWQFNVSNFTDAFGGFPPPLFLTPGQFAGSSPPGTPGGNASILANPVPEPGALAVIVVGGAAALLRRRRA